MRLPRTIVALSVCAAVLTGCPNPPEPPDAGRLDAAELDAGFLPEDATVMDAAAPDAEPTDAEAPDAEPADADAPDAETPDAEPVDAGVGPDAEPPGHVVRVPSLEPVVGKAQNSARSVVGRTAPTAGRAESPEHKVSGRLGAPR